MDISELGQYTSEFLENLTDNRKSGKTKVINIATSNSYQISNPTSQNSEKTIREMAHQIIKPKNLDTSFQIIKTTKFPDITKDANEIQRDQCKFVKAFKRINYPDYFTLELVKEKLVKYDISTLPDLQALTDIMIMLNNISSGQIGNPDKPGVKWFNRFLKDYNLTPCHLCKIGTVYAVMVHRTKNLTHAMMIVRETLHHNLNNNTSPAQNYVVLDDSKLDPDEEVSHNCTNLKNLSLKECKRISEE
ncbi:9499_t:CDS:2, partial [Cetraspora pellucida]